MEPKFIECYRPNSQAVVSLHSFNPDDYLNVGVGRTTHEAAGSNKSFTAEAARQLRDALIELYPVPRAKPDSFIDYQVVPVGNGKWDIVRRHLGVHHHPIGRFNNESEAHVALSAFQPSEAA